MIYPYRCGKCEHKWQAIKSVKEIEKLEECPSCKEPGIRYISRTSFYGAAVEDSEWNHGLGCVVKNSDHRKQLAKARGLEEIGNEPIESIHRHADGIQADRQKRHDAEIDDIITNSSLS